MDSQVEEIKAKTDITALIGQRVKLSKAGRNLKGLCPFHGEKSPSFMVSPERGTWHCFGCGEHGDAITFLEKYENLTFIEALEQLAKQVGIELVKSNRPHNPNQPNTQRLYDLLALTAKYYQYVLTEHESGKEAREYINTRGINQQTIKDYTLGFAPNSWQSLRNYLHLREYTDKEIELAGISGKSDTGREYDRFRGRLMFPVTDTMGRVVGFSGRSLGGDGGPKYLNSPEGEVFHKGRLLYGLTQAKEAIRQHNRLILVEGNIDVISSHQAGVSEVVAPLGTALTIEQVNVMKRFTQKVYISFDNDKAGQEAIRRSLSLFRQAEVEVLIIKLDSGKDPDELIQTNPAGWSQAIDQAKHVFDFYIDWVSQSFALDTERGQRQAMAELAPFIHETTNPVSRAFLLKKAADALGAKEQDLNQALAQRPVSGNFPNSSSNQPLNNGPVARPRPSSRQQVLAEHLLAQLLTLPAADTASLASDKIVGQLIIEALGQSTYQQIYRAILGSSQHKGQIELKVVIEQLSDEEVVVFDQLSLSSGALGANLATVGLASIESGLTAADTIEASYSDNLADITNTIWDLNYGYFEQQLKLIEKQQKQTQVVGGDVNELRKKSAQIAIEKAKWQRK